ISLSTPTTLGCPRTLRFQKASSPMNATRLIRNAVKLHGHGSTSSRTRARIRNTRRDYGSATADNHPTRVTSRFSPPVTVQRVESGAEDAPAEGVRPAVERVFVEPRWPVALTVAIFIAISIALRVAVPTRESLGPHWVVPAIEMLLLVCLLAADPAH